MGQKGLLISSMQKLINHIRKSQSNQQEIFYSLSRTDFKKILTNLEDENPMLRKTSLNLITELLSSNTKLKKKFCQTMEINLIPGKILFNSKALERQPSSVNLRNLLMMLKKQPDLIQSNCLLWFISTRSSTRQSQLQYIQKDKTKMQMQIDLDPQECIVGFCLSQADLAMEYSTITSTTEVSQQSKKHQLMNLIQPNPKKVISLVGAKQNSSISDSQPRYQRNNKTNPPETDRPKKFINSFLQQRKLNTTKGAETERYNTLNSQSSNIMATEPSYDMSKQITRSTMPKTTQSPYIPTLNLQNSANNFGYRTDRVSQTYVGPISRSKQMDFQKIKYQGIKVTTNSTTRSSYGNNIVKHNTDREYPSGYMTTTNNGFVSGGTYQTNGVGMNQQPNSRREVQNSFNFKYIKPIPMTTSNQEGVKFVNFFHKKHEDPQPLMEKKTLDVFQFIKNK